MSKMVLDRIAPGVAAVVKMLYRVHMGAKMSAYGVENVYKGNYTRTDKTRLKRLILRYTVCV